MTLREGAKYVKTDPAEYARTLRFVMVKYGLTLAQAAEKLDMTVEVLRERLGEHAKDFPS